MFTIPRLLRPIFARHRTWLGELCRIAARMLLDAYAEALPSARPGLILLVQTFGDLANFNPHVHVLAADGAFLPDGTFVFLPAVPEGLPAEGFRRAVLEFLLRHAAISEDLRAKLLGWRQEGRQGPSPVLAASRCTTRCGSQNTIPKAVRNSPAPCCAPRCPWRR